MRRARRASRYLLCAGPLLLHAAGLAGQLLGSRPARSMYYVRFELSDDAIVVALLAQRSVRAVRSQRQKEREIVGQSGGTRAVGIPRELRVWWGTQQHGSMLSSSSRGSSHNSSPTRWWYCMPFFWSAAPPTVSRNVCDEESDIIDL